MRCKVCGMEVEEAPKADADGDCMVCGRNMEGDQQSEEEE